MIHVILFKIAEEIYAIESVSIREISRTKELRLNVIPKVPPYIKGLVNLRGEIIPVVHLGECLGRETQGSVLPGRLLVVLAGSVPYGILVNQVLGHICLSEKCLKQPTDEMAVMTPYIKNIAHDAMETYFIIDVERLFQN